MRPITRLAVIGAAIALMGAATAASAYPNGWLDNDPWDLKVSAGGASLLSTFNIAEDDGTGLNKADFRPGIDTIDHASIQILVHDDAIWDAKEEMKLEIGSLEVGSHIQAWLNLVVLGATAELVGDIAADGILTYEIAATCGDFVVECASLEACGESPCNPVPEPATIIVWSLLGAGSWLGLGVWRRRGQQRWSPETRLAIHNVINGKLTR